MGAFSGVVAADQGNISFDSSTYTDGDVVTVTVEDSDLSTTTDYVVNIESDTESQSFVFGEHPGTEKKYTTEWSVSDQNDDNKISKLDITYQDSSRGGNEISSVSRNNNGTVTITFDSSPESRDGIEYTRGETVKLVHQTDAQFRGISELSTVDSIGALHVSEGDKIKSTYVDESSGEIRQSTARVDNDPEPLTLGSVTEFSIDSLSGASLTHTESVIEVPFSEDVSKAGGEAGALTLADNVTVLVDGADVTDRYALDTDGSTDGQLLLSSATALDPRSEVGVRIDAVNDSVDSETITPGTVDVTVASATVPEGSGEANVYAGSAMAFVATDGSADLDQAFEVVDDDGAFVFAGRTGPGSQVFVVDTDARNWTEAYTVETTLDDGSTDRTTGVTIRDLGLGVAIDDRNLTTAAAVEGTIFASAGGRTVQVDLRETDGVVVERTNITLGGNGETAFDFPASVFDTTGPGNYTVNVTDVGTDATVRSDRIAVVDDSLSTARFRSTVVGEHAGDVAEMGVNLAYAEIATVTLGSVGSGFRANVTVSDGDDDGTVRLRFNTAAVAGATSLPDDGGDVFGVAASSGNTSGTADEVIAADIDEGTLLSEPLASGEYEVTVRTGADAGADAEHAATLVLDAPAPERLTTWVAPADAALSTHEDLSTAVETGRLTQRADVAVGDLVVHRIDAPGLAGQFAQHDGTATETFFALDGTDEAALYALNVTQQNPPPNREAYQLELNASNARVVADPSNDTYTMLYEIDAPAATASDSEAVGTVSDGADTSVPAAGDALTASFAVHENGTFTEVDDDSRTVASNYSLVEATIATDDDPLVVAAAANQSISGTTTVAPGTEIELRLRSTNGTQPSFHKTTQAVVGPSGAWSAAFDFDAQGVGDTFEATSAAGVISDSNELGVSGEVRAFVPTTAVATTAATTVGQAGGAGGSGGVGSDGSGGSSRSNAAAPTTESTATPEQQSDGDGRSITDSTGEFFGTVIDTLVDGSGERPLRERLLDFDVLVALAALTTVLVFVTRLE